MRRRTFRRVLLSELVEQAGGGWEPAQDGEGRRFFSTFSSGHGEETLAEQRDDSHFGLELHIALERRAR